MAKGFKHGAGGTFLNVKVVAYATEEEQNAVTAKENTIGVITTDKITSWDYNASEPTAPTEGMVWICTNTASVVVFNALNKNGIQIYPIFAKQYVSGAWVQKTAKIWQGGEWVDINNKHFIFEEGKGVSPGYTVKSYFGNAYGFNISDDKITFCTDNRTGDHVWIEPMTNLAPYKNLFFEMTFTSRYSSAYTATIGAGVNIPAGEKNPGSFAAQASGIYNTARAVYQVPISNLVGDYYIKLAAYAMTGYIHNIWLEM